MKIKVTTEIDTRNHSFLEDFDTPVNSQNIFSILRSVINYKNMSIQKSMVKEVGLNDLDKKRERHYQESCRQDIRFMEEFIKNIKYENEK